MKTSGPSILSALLLFLIRFYQRWISPALTVAAGPGCGCRFTPTCSQYAADAVREHGALIGSWLALRRLVKCHPWHPGGWEPVPPRLRTQRPNQRVGDNALHPEAN
jgi:uncharacterized protein